jgi:hypothetical protein
MIWRNLHASNSTIYSVFREPSKELAEPLGSAEPRLKNTVVRDQKVVGLYLDGTSSIPKKNIYVDRCVKNMSL